MFLGFNASVTSFHNKTFPSVLFTFSCLVLEGHGRVDLPCMHAHPAAWVGQGRALRLPVVVARGHVAAC